MDLPRILPEEVLAHNSPGDVWVSVHGRVLDVSDLAKLSGSLASRIVFSYAGKDMSHMFDPETNEVCSEDTVGRILQRYKPYNSAAESYACLHNDRPVDLTKTLEENGVEDERDLFDDIGLPEDIYIPALVLSPRSLCTGPDSPSAVNKLSSN